MSFIPVLLMILLLITALFLIVLVLIQRGKGGGLAGAFGGMGGQSAFGTKAGDLFTRITIGVAAFWIILCIVSVKVLGISQTQTALDTSMGASAPAEPGSPAQPGSSDAGPAETAPGGGAAGAPAAPAAVPSTPPAGSGGGNAKP
jgi:preprotein translocase subunit SecG